MDSVLPLSVCRANPNDLMPQLESFNCHRFYATVWARFFSDVFDDSLPGL